jgi:microsomal dipeptidase-like Zn-dependent dipeptidase
MRQRKYSTEVIEKVIGGNFHRVLKEIWTVA